MVCEDDADEFEESTECGGIGGRGWKVASSGEMAVSLPLGAGGEHSLVSSITGVSKRSQGQMEKRGGGDRSPSGFSPGFVRRAPPRSLGAAAEVLGNAPAALLAADRAAPVELAVAAGHGLGAALLHRQAAVPAEPAAAAALPAAQGPAAPQALSALGTQQSQRFVLQAVVRGVLQVHQLPCGDGAEGVGDGASAGGTVASPLQQVHLESRVVLLLQVRAHLAELRQLQPAGLRGAAAGHTVALTRAFHGALHRLGRELGVSWPGGESASGGL